MFGARHDRSADDGSSSQPSMVLLDTQSLAHPSRRSSRLAIFEVPMQNDRETLVDGAKARCLQPLTRRPPDASWCRATAVPRESLDECEVKGVKNRRCSARRPEGIGGLRYAISPLAMTETRF